MNTAAPRGALCHVATLAFLLSLATGIAAPALAQEEPAEPAAEPTEPQTVDAEIRALMADLDQRSAEADELEEKIDASPDSAAATLLEKELSDRRADVRRDVSELVDLVLKAGDDGGPDVAQARSTVSEILERDATRMNEKLSEFHRKSVTLMDEIANATAEEVEEARQDFINAIPVSTRLTKYIDANIDLRKALGLDVEEDVQRFKEQLRARADMGAALLKTAKEYIDELAARPGIDQDAEAQKQLATMRKHRDILAESQRTNVDLMDEYGLETADLRRGIISATGKLSQDILDRDVASGLLESWLDGAADWVRTNGAELVFQMFTVLLVLLAFWVLSRLGRSAVRRGLDRSKLSVSSLAREFFLKMTGRLIMLIGIIIAIAQLGVEVGPLLAGLGIAGFVIGFALQDTLSNFASGMMILAYRPFDVGDAIEAGGVLGKVHKMNLVSTIVLTFDNQLLVVPNNKIWGDVIRNITDQTTRRVDLTFGIGYSDDIPKAEKILAEIVNSHDKVLKDPEPVIRLHELGESSVNFIVRPWSKTEDYWDVYWDVTREVKRRFDEEGVSIPFPQRDVHIYRDKDESEEKA